MVAFDREKIIQYKQYFLLEHECSFELLSGYGKVMLSAPHSVEQTRNGKRKVAEPLSGAITRLLHDDTGCPVIYKTRNCGDDANYDEISSYKTALADYIQQNGIRFVLDLHQLSHARTQKINVGTGAYKNVAKPYVDLAVDVFEKRKVGLVQVGKPFDARYPFTVSSYIARTCGISCMQIEINSGLFDLDATLKDVYEGVKELIQTLNELG